MLAWGEDGQRLALSDEPRARRASELVFGAVALLYPAWHWIFLAVMPHASDPLGERLIISALMIAAIGTFRVKRLRRYLYLSEDVALFIMTGHYLSIVWRNGCAAPYAIGTFVVLGAVTAVISRVAIAVAYAVFCMGTVGVMMGLSDNAVSFDLEYILGTATILVAIIVGAYKTSVVRNAALTRLSQGRQLLKQVIEAIPDPVFVRASDRQLLLANEAGRQFENATGYDLRAISDQEDLALSGGHTLEADTEVHTANGPMSVSLKTAVSTMADSPMMLVTIMRDVTERRSLEQSLRQKVRELEDARERVRQLQGMLPICMHCSRIRGEDGQWEKLESYVGANSNASFTHTLCNVCLEQHYPA